jgi:hypothetical protein
MESTAVPLGTLQDTEPQGEKVDFDRMMPGLASQLVDEFNRPGAHLTVRGAARRKKVPEVFVSTALFRDLYREMTELRRIVGYRSPTRSLQIVRKSA